MWLNGKGWKLDFASFLEYIRNVWVGVNWAAPEEDIIRCLKRELTYMIEVLDDRLKELGEEALDKKRENGGQAQARD